MSKQDLSPSLQKVLNRHGYPFQYAVLNRFEELFKNKRSPWLFEVAEFPVAVREIGTRIDFILRAKKLHIVLLVECKRANPSHSNWCFAKAPYVRRNRSGEFVMAEHLVRTAMNAFKSYATPKLELLDAYHLAVELRTNQKGDSYGKGAGEIEDAATQVCRGLNGMLEFYGQNYEVLKGVERALLLPVIITTANLFVTGVDLSAANIETGEIEVQADSIKQVPWVAYQYHLSPGIKAALPWGRELPTDLGTILDQEYVRTIPVVSATGIEAFVNWATHLQSSFSD